MLPKEKRISEINEKFQSWISQSSTKKSSLMTRKKSISSYLFGSECCTEHLRLFDEKYLDCRVSPLSINQEPST
jgi:hypothetical protein